MINSFHKLTTIIVVLWMFAVVSNADNKDAKVLETEPQYAEELVTEGKRIPAELVTDPWRNQYPLYNNYGERITGTNY